MANNHHRLYVLHPPAAFGANERRFTPVFLSNVALASLLGVLLATGPVQLVARVTLSALVVAIGGRQVVRVLRDVRAHDWRRLGRFAWLQYPALVVGLLLVLLPGYAVFVVIYPALQSSGLTHGAIAIAVGLLALLLALLALTLLAVVVVLLALPAIIVRARVRERQRRPYHFPSLPDR